MEPARIGPHHAAAQKPSSRLAQIAWRVLLVLALLLPALLVHRSGGTGSRAKLDKLLNGHATRDRPLQAVRIGTTPALIDSAQREVTRILITVTAPHLGPSI